MKYIYIHMIIVEIKTYIPLFTFLNIKYFISSLNNILLFYHGIYRLQYEGNQPLRKRCDYKNTNQTIRVS